MNIYMDESGSFVHASTLGAWNAVAALATTEHADEEIHHHLAQLKLSNGLDPVWFDLNHGFLPDFDDSFKKYKIYSSLLNISEGHSIS